MDSTNSYLQHLFAERIGGRRYGASSALYKFEKIKRATAAARKAKPHVPLIDMGVGEPDAMASPDVLKALRTEAAKTENRGYADNGCAAFKEAAATCMENYFGVSGIDPETEVMHSIGSKAALSLLPACFVNPGDIVLMTTPGYGIFGVHTRYYGGTVHALPLREENGFLPDLDTVPLDVLKRAKVLVLNYPNNPTGACATPDFFAKVVAFAKTHDLVVVQDAAYAGLVFDGPLLSIFQTPGAKDVAVELHSLSKAFNMTGWRIGFVVGNPLIIRAYGDVKDNSDSGQFLAIQKAAIRALGNPNITQRNTSKYARRFDLLVAALRTCGFDAIRPGGTFFLYTRAPKAVEGPYGQVTKFENAEAFSQWLIQEQLISTVPWDEQGAYIRFSVTFEALGKDTVEAERVVIEELCQRLAPYTFRFS